MSRKTIGMVWIVALAIVALEARETRADQPGDAWITTKVKMGLLTEESVNGFDVDVDTVDGLVTLHGPVASEAEKDAAAQRALKVNGVREVRNLLVVVPLAMREVTKRTDEELSRQVATVLERDRALEGSDVRVKSVNDGVVLLAGRADTLSAHRRALEDARSVAGVRQVASEIQSPDSLGDDEIWRENAEVEPPDASDAAADLWIATKAKVLLLSEANLSPLDVHVDSRRGVVTLFGVVGSETAKGRAGAVVAKLDGVQAVRNDLQVVPDVAAAVVKENDAALKAAVEERLDSREDLADADVSVAVSDGVVRLSGTVASKGDRITALTVAKSTDGTESVIDDLVLEER